MFHSLLQFYFKENLCGDHELSFMMKKNLFCDHKTFYLKQCTDPVRKI